MRADLPAGTVTFVFTDVEGSTRLLDELGADAYAEALAKHRRVVREAVASAGGAEVDTQGDAFFLAFARASDALAAAAAITEQLREGPIRLRMGVHTGTPLLTDEGYVGADVHRAARIGAAGHGGQVLVSASTAALVETQLRDLGEHRFKDLSAAERVFQLGDAGFPPLKTLHRSNLPVPATSFLGREEELSAVVGLFDGARLVTLTGPGGTGKTRLALQAAARVSDRFPDGVFWVALAPLRDPALVLPAIAGALRVPEEPDRPLAETLAEAFAHRRPLLLLDNAEHLLPELADEVDCMITDSVAMSFLVTSRERLQLPGEQVYAVPPLSEPTGVALFLTRARQLDPDSTGTPAVAELCRRLDGLPLAIELAAARTAVFSAEQLLDRIGDRLDLLTGGRRADQRQRTLRETIDWSHELLTDEERHLYRQLSVFVGGCSFDAAEAVCGADPDVLQSLLDKSLLRRTRSASGDGRYWMLETIREHAAEQLRSAGEATATRERHLRWYARRVGDLGEALRIVDADAVAWVASEYPNIRAAMTEAVGSGGDAALVGFVEVLWPVWWSRADYREAESWFAAALESTEGMRDGARVTALRLVGLAARRFGRYDEAAGFYSEALEISTELDDPIGRARILSALGRLEAKRGTDVAQVTELFDESVALQRDAGASDQEMGVTLYEFGAALLECRTFESAREPLAAARASFVAAAFDYGTNMTGQALGYLDIRTGHLEEGLALSAEALAYFHDAGDLDGVMLGLGNISTGLLRGGLVESAAVLDAASSRMATELGVGATALDEALRRESAERYCAELPSSVWELAVARGSAMTVDEAVAFALEACSARSKKTSSDQ